MNQKMVFKGNWDQALSNVWIHSGLAKDFGSESDISEWVRTLDDSMAVACYKAVQAIASWKQSHGAISLTWDQIQTVFNDCIELVKAKPKNFLDSKTYSKDNVFKVDGSPDESRKREIITWLKELFNRHGEQDIVDNSVIFHNGVLDKLASIASESGVAVKDFGSFFHGEESKTKKEMEIGVIRFPTKGAPIIKLYRFVISAYFHSERTLFVQHDSNGLKIDYSSVEYHPNTATIDASFAAAAKERLKDPSIYEF